VRDTLKWNLGARIVAVPLRRNPGDELVGGLILDADAACEMRGLDAAASRLRVRVALAFGIPGIQMWRAASSVAAGFCDPWCRGQTDGIRAENSGDTRRQTGPLGFGRTNVMNVALSRQHIVYEVHFVGY
jgi:hypothetical protein